MLVQFLCLVVALSNGRGIYRVQAKLQGASEGFEGVLKSCFPDDAEFNESCVSEGCPTLKNFSICPTQVNITVLHSVLKTAIGCMRKPICGILMDNRPIIGTSTTTDDWLPGMDIDGCATTLPGVSHLSNVSNIEFLFQPDHNQNHQLPLQLTMLVPQLCLLGRIQLQFSLRTKLSSITGQALSVNIPDVKYDVAVEYVSTMSINHSITHSNFEIKILNAIVKANPVFCGLELPEGFPNILTLFTLMTQVIIDKSSWAFRHSVFYEKYFQSAFRIVSNSC